ncbi:hypothetical protein [Bradyrhizobium sp. JYMT SZCCT0428]|uniref:hypothetical protein n=1 Tax=Bradyrhizobium sp. JYMT SZCCT0428 TaxID=2807673 RepID=UPI001BAD24A9|nr:hypothetical protein [Bradyrhizobium sp. JYMT SZCCT0428]MBR1153930.1 hypothetical protein [Bradyrhizobium sp. JYMT SZCCT0428]
MRRAAKAFAWIALVYGVPLAVAVVSLVATTLLYLRLFGVIQWRLPWGAAG